jgi:hypothetical protein
VFPSFSFDSQHSGARRLISGLLSPFLAELAPERLNDPVVVRPDCPYAVRVSAFLLPSLAFRLFSNSYLAI